MGTPSVGKGRRRAWLVAMLVGAFGLFLTLGAGSAFASSCSVVSGTGAPGAGYVLQVNVNNETAVLSVGSLSHINLNGGWCAPATIATTDLINVVGGGAADTLVIDESGGYFQPGATTERAGTNEIEFLLGSPGTAAGVPANTASNTVENLIINGNATADHIFIGDGQAYTGTSVAATPPELGADAVNTPPLTAGAAAGFSDNEVPLGSIGIVNLNGDGDADVFLAADTTANTTNTSSVGYPAIAVFGNSGGDDIAGVGTHGTGAVTDHDLFINGGPGDDSLIGGSGDDIFQTGSGNDVVDGGSSGEDPFLGSFCETLFDTAGNPDFALLNGDTIDYSGSTGPITVDLDPKELHPGIGTKPDGTDVIQNVEHVIGSPANDTLSGDNART